jgi:hypothetical protein
LPLKQACPAPGAFAFFAVRLALRGEFRREKCNMLQKSLVKTVLRVNIRKKKASLEEKNAVCCKNLLQNCVEGECWEEKGKFRREKCNILQKSLLKKVS